MLPLFLRPVVDFPPPVSIRRRLVSTKKEKEQEEIKRERVARNVKVGGERLLLHTYMSQEERRQGNVSRDQLIKPPSSSYSYYSVFLVPHHLSYFSSRRGLKTSPIRTVIPNLFSFTIFRHEIHLPHLRSETPSDKSHSRPSLSLSLSPLLLSFRPGNHRRARSAVPPCREIPPRPGNRTAP